MRIRQQEKEEQERTTGLLIDQLKTLDASIEKVEKQLQNENIEQKI